MAKLRDVAEIVRSKNAGAFVLTIDLMFADEETLMSASRSETLNAASIARIYGVEAADVSVELAPKARAVKISLPRRTPSGHFGDQDIYGALQYVPLLELEVSTPGGR